MGIKSPHGDGDVKKVSPASVDGDGMGKVSPRGDGDGVLTPDGEFPVAMPTISSLCLDHENFF